MATIRLKATREGSLLSLLIDREISEQQLEAINAVLDDDMMAYNVVEDARILKLVAVERAPVGGIEQYQAEDR